MAHGKKKTALTLLIIFFLADALLIALVIQRYHAKASAPTEPEPALVLNPDQKEVGEQKFLTHAHLHNFHTPFTGRAGHV